MKCFCILILPLFLFFSCSYQHDFDQPAVLSDAPGVTLQNHNETIVVNPASPSENALIFYPGGSVDYASYLPLLVKCAKNGVKCFLPQMPYDLAILEISAADRLRSDYPEIKNWYIGGHSLGGAMAASYVASHAQSFKGLVLLAAYSTKDLKSSGLKVLSLYGSKDGVLKMDNYGKCLSNLPSGYEEHVIEGGNHGQFGSYGFQKGDNEAGISAYAQQTAAADFIGEFCR
ncbi:MAG: alpha/beta hydrolase [Treponema sp.]|nr:alpha/beta hydrolase [Treponema sp.]